MATTKIQSADAALEAQVFWLRYRRELVFLLLIAVVAISSYTGYRFYRERRENAAAALFASAKTSSDYRQVIDRYGDTPAAGSAYLLLADSERKERKFAEANATLQKFIDKFPQHDLVQTARMAMAANLQSIGKDDEALAMYQLIGSAGAGDFNAPQALFEQAQILQTKNRIEDARRACERIMTQYRDSYAAMEAARLLRLMKPASEAAKAGAATASPSPGSVTASPVPISPGASPATTP